MLSELFGNSNAISVLLNDPEIKVAILDYLKAETDKVKPKSEWREVWRQSGEQRALVIPHDPYTGQTNARCACVARLMILFHEEKETATALAMLTQPGMGVWMEYPWRFGGDELLRESRSVQNYVEAVVWGQSLWVEVAKRFEERTEAIALDGTS